VLRAFGFVERTANPEGDEGGQQAGEKDGSPAEVGQHDSDDGGADSVADGPRALHEGECLIAMLLRPAFSDERCAGGPFASHAEAENEAAEKELERSLCEAAERGKDGVDEDAPGKRASTAVAVCERAEEDAADGAGDECDGYHGSADGRAHVHGALQRAEDECIEHDVHAVEHPAEGGCDEYAALGGRGLSEPAVDSVQWRPFML